MNTITIIWKRNIEQLPEGHVMEILSKGTPLTAYLTFEWDFDGRDDESICDAIYSATNRYDGDIWNHIENDLPNPRPHTALSICDQVVIDGRIWECRPFGWEQIDTLANFKRNLG